MQTIVSPAVWAFISAVAMTAWKKCRSTKNNVGRMQSMKIVLFDNTSNALRKTFLKNKYPSGITKARSTKAIIRFGKV
jgi:hypothetical protein